MIAAMLFNNVAIQSVVSVDPPNRVASTEIQERLQDTLQRLRVRGNPLIDLAGIEERRYWDDGMHFGRSQGTGTGRY